MESINNEEDLVDYYGMQDEDEDEDDEDEDEDGERENGSFKSTDELGHSSTTAKKPKKILVHLKRNREEDDDDNYDPKMSSRLGKSKPTRKNKSKKLATVKELLVKSRADHALYTTSAGKTPKKKQAVTNTPPKGPYVRLPKANVKYIPANIPGPFRLKLRRPLPTNPSMPKAPSGIHMHYCDICKLRIYYVSADGWERHLKKKHGIGIKDEMEEEEELHAPDSPEVMIIPETTKPEPEIVDLEDDDNGPDVDHEGTTNLSAKPAKNFRCGTCEKKIDFDKRREHKCFYYQNRGKSTKALEHDCSVLERVIRYTSRRGLNKHLRKYHKKTEDNVEVKKAVDNDDGGHCVDKELNRRNLPKKEPKIFECKTCGETVLYDRRQEHTCLSAEDLEHNCAVLQKVIRYATRSGLMKHLKKYHENGEESAKVFVQDDGSVAVLQQDDTQKAASSDDDVPLSELITMAADEMPSSPPHGNISAEDEQITNIDESGLKLRINKRKLAGFQAVKTKKNGKKDIHKHSLRNKNGRYQSHLRKDTKMKKQHSKVASKLVAKASKHMNTVKNYSGRLKHTYMCALCQLQFEDVRALDIHECHLAMFISRVCKACIKWFKNYYSYNSHHCGDNFKGGYMRRNGEQGCWKVCHECNEFFDSLKDAREHITDKRPKCLKAKSKSVPPVKDVSQPVLSSMEDKSEFDFGLKKDNNTGIKKRVVTLNKAADVKNRVSVEVEYMYANDVINGRSGPDFRSHWLLKK